MFGLDSFFKEPYQDLQDKYKSMLLQVDHILIISYLLILFKREIFSLLLSQTYLPGYPQIYIWVGFLIHMYILVRFVSYGKDVRDSKILREQEEHLRSLEAYNEKSKLPIRVYAHLNMIMKIYSLVCRQVLIVGILTLLNKPIRIF